MSSAEEVTPSRVGMAIATNGNVKVLQATLGHANAIETLDTYADVWPDQLDSVASALDEARTLT